MAAAARPDHQIAACKLRNSCDSCAAAKVGCNKEKPTCARCAKRGLPCVYGATRRARRISQGKHQAALNAAALMMAQPSPTPTTTQTLDNTPASSMTPSGTGVFLPWPDFSQPSSGPFSPSYSDIFATLLSPTAATSTLTPATSSPDLGELLTSVVSLPRADPSDCDLSAPSFLDFGCDDFSDHSSSNYHSLSNGTSSDSSSLSGNNRTSRNDINLFPGSSQAIAPPTPRTAFPSSRASVFGCATPSSAAARALPGGPGFRSDLSCRCLMRALGLFAQLPPPSTSEACTQSDKNDSSSQLPQFERLVAQNEQTVEAVSTILRCPCSNDGYLLVVLSLIVFTILAWYTAAASAMPGEDQSLDVTGSPRRPERAIQEPSTSVGGYDFNREDQGRLDAQLVLSKLHGVQRLVNLLSQRLQKLRDKPHCDDVPFESSVQESRQIFNLPFSANLLHTLEADMRKRLRELSRAIIDRLRRG